MRRQVVLYMTALGVLLGALFTGAKAQVTLNNRQINYSQQTFSIGQFLMVPLNETLAFLGGTPATWDPERLEARFTYNGNDVVIRPRSGYAVVNDQSIILGVPAVVRDDSLFVPLSFMREQLGVQVAVAEGVVESGVRARVLGFRGAPEESVIPGQLAIGGQPLFRLHSSATFASIDERMAQVTERMIQGLQRAMQMNQGAFSTSQVTMAVMDGLPTIFVAGVPVVSVTAEDAAAANTDQMTLANEWLQQIRNGLNAAFPES